MDADGSLGIRDAPDELLAQARERTRGFPRALEALAAILAADRDTTLPELLADTERLPENVVEALVGEAFNRLDALAQQVMQALAIYPGSVPPVAVDYLLRPFQPGIDSATVLGRLVDMQFVRRDAGHYYLHQVDRDYALRRVPAGEPSDRHADPPPFSQYALRERAADYFQQTRTPRETWRTLDDLAPQLAEFELRCQAGDFDTAAGVLLDISSEYLELWGHVRLARDLHEHVHGHLSDPWTNAANLTSLGNAYFSLGEVRRAIEFYEQALAIFREIGRREAEALALIYLAGAYTDAGTWPQVIRCGEQGVRIADEVGLAQGSSEGRMCLAIAHLCAGEFDLARATAQDARGYDYAPMSDNVAVVLGIALAREGHVEEARHAFRAALNAADALLAQTADAYDELDNRALALCGLALAEEPGRACEACEAFRAARAITGAGGIVGRVLRLFDVLAAGDKTDVLAPVRSVAAGEA